MRTKRRYYAYKPEMHYVIYILTFNDKFSINVEQILIASSIDRVVKERIITEPRGDLTHDINVLTRSFERS